MEESCENTPVKRNAQQNTVLKDFEFFCDNFVSKMLRKCSFIHSFKTYNVDKYFFQAILVILVHVRNLLEVRIKILRKKSAIRLNKL